MPKFEPNIPGADLENSRIGEQAFTADAVTEVINDMIKFTPDEMNWTYTGRSSNGLDQGEICHVLEEVAGTFVKEGYPARVVEVVNENRLAIQLVVMNRGSEVSRLAGVISGEINRLIDSMPDSSGWFIARQIPENTDLQTFALAFEFVARQLKEDGYETDVNVDRRSVIPAFKLTVCKPES